MVPSMLWDSDVTGASVAGSNTLSMTFDAPVTKLVPCTRNIRLRPSTVVHCTWSLQMPCVRTWPSGSFTV